MGAFNVEAADLKIFVASLYPSFIQCLISNHDATLENVQGDDKALLLTSDLCFRDNSHLQTCSGLSYTILISSTHALLIITLFGHPRIS